MGDTVIKVENLWKEYRLGVVNHNTLTRDLQSWWSRILGKDDPNSIVDGRPQTSGRFWALEGVSFDVKKGDVVGIIGRNGAGKSTILKILSQVTTPTKGVVRFNGRIASLLEVGTGFHPELTGRENIFLNGAILGLSKANISKKLDEIVAFADIEQFLDTPVKRYSSGMYVRLAFAVAAHLDSEILLVDEVLAVGDIAFKKKCIGKMGEIGQCGRTIIFISHDMTQINSLCNKSILIDNGKLLDYGDARTITTKYLDSVNDLVEIKNPNIRSAIPANFKKGPKIESVSISDTKGNLKTCFTSLESIVVNLKIRPELSAEKQFSAVWFLHDHSDAQIAVGASTPMDTTTYPQSTTCLSCVINPISLLPGSYRLRFVFHIPYHEMFDDWPNAIRFEIIESDVNQTGYSYPGIWSAQQYVQHKWK